MGVRDLLDDPGRHPCRPGGCVMFVVLAVL